jgi:4-hydroxy-tetrahydrodipicolinate synthase
MTVLSGDDVLTLPMMSLGAKGVISVASNIVPAEVKKMVDLANANDFASAMKLNSKLYPLFRDLFVETNPIPVKAAMAMMGMIEEEYRLPLCEMSPKNRDMLKKTLKACGMI